MSTGYEGGTFRMPLVKVGTIVLWYPSGSASTDPQAGPLAAIVVRVNSRSVALNIVSAENHNFLLREGARHVSDPELKRDAVREEGAWDYTDQDKNIERLMATLKREKEGVSK